MGKLLSYYPLVKDNLVVNALIGSFFITLCSLVKIPLSPVPITLQTFAIVILALTQTPKVCVSAIVLYLIEATVGLPVLSGHSNPLWMIGKTAGYLMGFPIAGYLISTMTQSVKSVFLKIIYVFLGQSVIHMLGFLWLSLYFGYKTAFTLGVVVFIPIDIVKTLLAVSLVSFFNDNIKNKFNTVF